MATIFKTFDIKEPKDRVFVTKDTGIKAIVDGVTYFIIGDRTYPNPKTSPTHIEKPTAFSKPEAKKVCDILNKQRYCFPTPCDIARAISRVKLSRYL